MLAFSLLGCSPLSGPWVGSWAFDTQSTAQSLVLDGVFEVTLASEEEIQGDHLTRTFPVGSPQDPSGVYGSLYGIYTGAQWQIDLRQVSVLANDESAWGQDWVVLELALEGQDWHGRYTYCVPSEQGCQATEEGEIRVVGVAP